MLKTYKKNNNSFVIKTLALIIISGIMLYYFYDYKTEVIKNDIYKKKAVEMKIELESLIAEKQGDTASITHFLSKMPSVKKALLLRDKSVLDFSDILLALANVSQFKNIWIQIVDADGYNIYRSWMEKSGDYMLKARKDMAMMIKNPKPMDHISTGKFDMTFKTMRPIFHEGKYIGMVEMITHFNSIAEKLKAKKIEPVMIVDEPYTDRFMKPFTGLFIGRNYVANLNASKELMKKIEQHGIKKFLYLKNFMLLDGYLVTTYRLPDLSGGDMGFHVLFSKLKDLEMTEYSTFKNSYLIFIIMFVVLGGLGITATVHRKHLLELKHLNSLLEEEKVKALKATESKSYFLANMSHEIRTPMNGIIGATDLVMETNLNPQQKDFLHDIKTSASSLLYLINDILDFSKIEAGLLTIEKNDFDIHCTIKNIMSMMKVISDEKAIDLEYEIINVPKIAYGDELRLRQIILNLMSNAVKFTSKGSVKLHAELHSDSKEEFVLKIAIEDTGIGIEPDKIKSIFDKFTQADSSIVRSFGGSGLGLSISKQLVEMMNGEIYCESIQGEGSTFHFTVKLEHSNKINLATPAIAPEEIVKGAKVLLVEDNPMNRKIARLVLEKDKHEIIEAESGLIAIETLKEQDVDLVLMDVQMPVMDGLQATRIIRAFEQGTNTEEDNEKISGHEALSAKIKGKHVPIIGLTANAMQGDKETCLNAGMDDFIAKPFKTSEIRNAIARFTKQT